MTRLQRRNGRLVAKVVAYESSNTKKPFKIVFPKGYVNQLPKTANGVVWVKYFKQGSIYAMNQKKPIFVKASTARKMDLQ